MAVTVNEIEARANTLVAEYCKEVQLVTSANQGKFKKEFSAKHQVAIGENYDEDPSIDFLVEIEDVLEVQDVWKHEEIVKGFLGIKRKIVEARYTLLSNGKYGAHCTSDDIALAFDLKRGEKVRIRGMADVKCYFNGISTSKLYIKFRGYPKITRVK